MARTGRKKATNTNGDSKGNEGESITAYFRRKLMENPKLIKTRSNEELMRHWLNDNPGETKVPNSVKAGLANAKSGLRQKLRKRRKNQGQEQQTAAAPARLAPVIIHRLESLEEQIDDCLSVAKGLDRQELENVIRLLRKARNEVVWKLG